MIVKKHNSFWIKAKNINNIPNGWELSTTLFSDIITENDLVQVEPKSIKCKCGVGYDPFLLKRRIQTMDLCPFCELEGRKTYLKDLILHIIKS